MKINRYLTYKSATLCFVFALITIYHWLLYDWLLHSRFSLIAYYYTTASNFEYRYKDPIYPAVFGRNLALLAFKKKLSEEGKTLDINDILGYRYDAHGYIWPNDIQKKDADDDIIFLVRVALERGWGDVNKTSDWSGCTLLQDAMYFKDDAVINLLVKHGASKEIYNPNARVKSCRHPIAEKNKVDNK